jgi:GTP-binding protein
MPPPLVAIVGAPNVGKSTLFNRLVGRRRAIVTDEPGVTRDRLYGEVSHASRPFCLVDTGGLMPGEEHPLAREIERQADAALEEASVVLFVVDARAGATALDLDLAQMLRRRGCRLMLVANKVDGDEAVTRITELHALGLGPPLAISAEHGRGVDALVEALESLLPEHTAEDAAETRLNVAIVGRPNVGKSSVVNRLLGEERVVVSEHPGTTRDAVDTLLEIGERRYRLVDTAGLRRPGKVRHVVERFSAERAKQNIQRCDVAVLVLDGSQSLAAQDAHVAGAVCDARKPMVLVVNKWDLVEGPEEAVKSWEETIRYRLGFTRGAPVVFASALTGQRVLKILDRVDEIHEAAGLRVPTQLLNRWLEAHPAGRRGRASRGAGFRVYYATQTGTHPPSFVLFCNDPTLLHFSTRRRIENELRASFGFGSVPIRLEFRRRRKA